MSIRTAVIVFGIACGVATTVGAQDGCDAETELELACEAGDEAAEDIAPEAEAQADAGDDAGVDAESLSDDVAEEAWDGDHADADGGPFDVAMREGEADEADEADDEANTSAEDAGKAAAVDPSGDGETGEEKPDDANDPSAAVEADPAGDPAGDAAAAGPGSIDQANAAIDGSEVAGDGAAAEAGGEASAEIAEDQSASLADAVDAGGAAAGQPPVPGNTADDDPTKAEKPGKWRMHFTHMPDYYIYQQDHKNWLLKKFVEPFGEIIEVQTLIHGFSEESRRLNVIVVTMSRQSEVMAILAGLKGAEKPQDYKLKASVCGEEWRGELARAPDCVDADAMPNEATASRTAGGDPTNGENQRKWRMQFTDVPDHYISDEARKNRLLEEFVEWNGKPIEVQTLGHSVSDGSRKFNAIVVTMSSRKEVTAILADVEGRIHDGYKISAHACGKEWRGEWVQTPSCAGDPAP